jgi:hypothetical protein
MSRIEERRRTISVAPEIAPPTTEAFRPVAARPQVLRIVDISSSIVDNTSNVEQDDDPEWLGNANSLHPGMHQRVIPDGI